MRRQTAAQPVGYRATRISRLHTLLDTLLSFAKEPYTNRVLLLSRQGTLGSLENEALSQAKLSNLTWEYTKYGQPTCQVLNSPLLFMRVRVCECV